MKIRSSAILFRFLPTLSAAVVSLFVFFLNENQGYRLLFLHPLIFAICYFVVLHRIFRNKLGSRPFLTTLTLICAIRFVILPAITVASGHYYGRSWVNPLDSSLELAIVLMAWEFVCVSVLVLYLEKRKKRGSPQIPSASKASQSPELLPAPSVYYGYYAFALIVMALLGATPAALQTINVLLPRALTYDIVDLSTTERLFAYAFFLAKNLVAVGLIVTAASIWRSRRPLASAIIASVIAILAAGIYWGGSRIDILIPAVAFGIILHRLFGKTVIPFLALGLLVVGAAITFVSLERQNITASGGTEPWIDAADTLQVYVGGAYNVAIAVETRSYFPDASRWAVLGMDIFRPMLGVNFFLKEVDVPYSNVYFNERLWTHVDRRSQILPMVGQGYIHFGLILSPLLTLVFVCLAFRLERLYHESSSWEVKFILLLVLLRLGFAMGQNSMNMINDMSMNLLLFFLVYKANIWLRLLVRRR